MFRRLPASPEAMLANRDPPRNNSEAIAKTINLFVGFWAGLLRLGFSGWHSIPGFYISVFGVEERNGHEIAFEFASGVDLGAVCTTFRAGPVWRGPGAKLSLKTTENRRNLKHMF